MKLLALIIWSGLSVPIGTVWLASELRDLWRQRRHRRRRFARGGHVDPEIQRAFLEDLGRRR